MRDEITRAVAAARRMFEFGAEQVYLAVDENHIYVTDDPLDDRVVAAARNTSQVERAGVEISNRHRFR